MYRIISHLKSMYGYLQRIKGLPRHLQAIREQTNKPSYYPERKRKNKARIWLENLSFLFKYGESNIHYLSHGFDTLTKSEQENYLLEWPFSQMRDKGNQGIGKATRARYNSLVLLRDKYVFAAYLSSVLSPHIVPNTVGLIEGDMIYLMHEHCWRPLESFFQRSFNYVMKQCEGECADGVYMVHCDAGMVSYGDKTEHWQDFIKKLREGRFLVQEKLHQHDALSKLNPSCINTVRIITIANEKREIGVFNAFLRLGADQNSFVDNRAKGGIGVGVNLETGQLKARGFVHEAFGTTYERHPITGVSFEEYQLPFWDRTCQLVKQAHRQFFMIQSIGWDVVISENGPILLEGNDNWEIGGPQDTAGGLKQRWEELTSSSQ